MTDRTISSLMLSHFSAMVLVLSLASLWALYVAFASIARMAWRVGREHILGMDHRRSQSLLLGIVVGPLLLSAAMVAGLILPALLRYEPHQSAETPGLFLIGMAAAALGLGLLRMKRVVLGLYGNWRAVHRYRQSSVPYGQVGDVPVVLVEVPGPVVVLMGTWKPRIYVSKDVAEQLSREQLQSVIEHEMAHHRNHDVGSQWLLRFAGESGGSALQARKEWSLRAELIADSDAADAAGDSLLLAEALTRVAGMGRLASVRPAVAACLTSDAYSDLRLRVEMLLRHSRGAMGRRTNSWASRIGLLAGLGGLVLLYGPLMAWTFRAVEFLAM